VAILASVLVQQAERTEGAKSMELLGQAVTAYHSALKVFTREAFPVYHQVLGQNLENAQKLLGQTKANAQ
jgi:hypothetical protein